jgi:hypothetical protein
VAGSSLVGNISEVTGTPPLAKQLDFLTKGCNFLKNNGKYGKGEIPITGERTEKLNVRHINGDKYIIGKANSLMMHALAT